MDKGVGTKVGTPIQGRPPPQPRSGQGEGVPQGRYPPNPMLVPIPPSQVRRGYLPWGTPPPEHLLHGERYASCVHAGGLSCSDIQTKVFLKMFCQGKKKDILNTRETDAVTSSGDSQVIAPTAAKSVRIDLWKLVANSTNCKHLKI